MRLCAAFLPPLSLEGNRIVTEGKAMAVAEKGSKRGIQGLLSEEREADQLDVSVRTLRRWRKIGYGPAVTYLGRTPYYTPNAHAEFIVSQERPVMLPPVT